VPDDWKSAIITPVFKKGAEDNVENYRPISLTCVSGKIMECLIAKQIYGHLKCNYAMTCYHVRSMVSKGQVNMYKSDSGRVSEMTHTVSSGTLNSSIPYHTIPI